MAVPACLRLSDEVFPKVRAAAARQLVAQGWSQSRAAQAVGLSQAMVSRHVAAPAKPEPLVEALAAELVAEAREPTPAQGVSAWCATLSVSHAMPGADEALADLLAAERALRGTAGLRLVPQVGLNLARALPAASGPQDVLAFPGRLVDAGGRLVAPVPPSFGGSGHLARLLLHLRGLGRAELALANVRGGPASDAAAKRLGWRVAELAGTGSDEERFRRAATKDPAADAYHEPGAVGLEPCLYLPARDARHAAQRILGLNDRLK